MTRLSTICNYDGPYPLHYYYVVVSMYLSPSRESQVKYVITIKVAALGYQSQPITIEAERLGLAQTMAMGSHMPSDLPMLKGELVEYEVKTIT